MKCTKEYRLSFTSRAKNLVSRMTLEEKVFLMSGWVGTPYDFPTPEDPKDRHYNFHPYGAGGCERLGLEPMLFCDGPRGVVSGTGKTTCYPVSMCRGAAFDPELEEEIGRAIGKEVLASGGNLFAGVCINLPYNPGWGRSQETYGEDCFAIGQLGSALVRGVQAENVIACVKHFAFNSMEFSRFKVSVDCSRRTEREVFLPHFRDCVDAGAASIMSAYNKYQGVHCGHNAYLLRKVLKEEWDFDGFVMSDFIHGVRATVEAANGGQDMEMCWTHFFGQKLVDAVRDGRVPEARIDDAALRIVRTLLAFQTARQEDGIPGTEVLNCSAHRDLALRAAREGITLMKNDGMLPLDRGKIRRLAVLGKLAEKENIGDWGSSRVYPPYVVTPVEGHRRIAPDTELIFCDGSDLEAAKKAAREADAVVFVVGLDHGDEGEYVAPQDLDPNQFETMGGDRKDLGLHRDEINLILAAAPENENNIVVLMGGNTLLVEPWFDQVHSVLMAYYPRQEGGIALAEILFGDVNPSGKLPFVLPKRAEDLPAVDWDGENQWYDHYHGYTLLDKAGTAPLLPYGFGLSYTAFALSSPAFGVEGDQLWAKCRVKNTGDRDGDEVIQLYVGFGNSSLDRPSKLLRGFSRVSLASGEENEVVIRCPLEKLAYYDPKESAFRLEHMEYPVYIGSSSDPRDLLEGSVIL
ncbi:MAG: glycoside hydrolase family 3 C-terminal domain-containing protein [Oscillospiraceae bacterium]|nr:glycoside hydrolase family 3 C-terminal domain-containing protein [Oscillospiraceae bacterium]